MPKAFPVPISATSSPSTSNAQNVSGASSKVTTANKDTATTTRISASSSPSTSNSHH
ncbi:198_t:CDS:2 [Gigaspora margarita]|uniref:198_t:CDS:1 n=1 Tax=Gigaspora margarita TaxID=4874 RepID=A0ABM8VXM7_GIGMA|nr:198_t:CDS:2 [Gigaspora margarita]